MCVRIFGRDYRTQLGGNLLPAAIVLLEPQLELAMSLEVDERGFAVDWVRRIIKDVRFKMPIPLAAIAGGRPRNMVLWVC
jgi:hypothetical protein